MRKVVVAALVVFACFRAPAHGQAPPPATSPVVAAVKALQQRISEHIVGAAEAMPADKYAYQPTPAQMTFARLMAHVAQTNMVICSTLTTSDPPFDLDRLRDVGNLVDKAAIVPVLKQSFEYCGGALAGLSDAQLGRDASFLGRSAGSSQAVALVTLATDWADHYSTAAGYLRLNGLVPPSAAPTAAK